MRILAVVLLFTTLTLQAETTPLTKAIRLEKFDEAKKHLTPELVNKPDDGLYHPLTYAVYTGNNKFIETLLKAGANPNTIEHNGKTALYVAANLDNPQLITLLHNYGAKYPTAKNSSSPAKAAVYSASVKNLQTLLKHYPEIDLNVGWPTPSYLTQRKLCSALNYACYHAYNDIALLLLRHGAVTTIQDWDGNSALHYAAADHRCSVQLVEALLQAGLNPITDQSNGHIHIIPTSPLERAAASGSIHKVKAMLKGKNIKELTKNINQAAFIASAQNKSHIAKYLFNLISKETPNSTTWLNTNKNRIKSELQKSKSPNHKKTHNPIRALDIRELMPRPLTSTLNIDSGTVAIIAPPSLQNIAVLISSELSKIEGLKLLERDLLNRLLEENQLKNLQISNPSSLQQHLNIIPAKHLVILTTNKHNNKTFTQIILINTSSGSVRSRFALPTDIAPGTKEFNTITASLLHGMQQSIHIEKQAIAISITPVKPESPTEETLAASDLINTILPYLVTNSRGCVQLSRKQIQYLETEKAFGSKNAYWKAGWTIDGSIKTDTPNKVTVVLRASSTRNGNTLVTQASSVMHETASATKKAWIAMLKKINLGEPLDARKLIPNEPQILNQHAEWLILSGYPEDALELTQASIALGSRTAKTQQLLLRAQLASLPISRSNCCRHIRSTPQYLESVKKIPLAKNIPDYLDLCNSAIRYTTTLKKAYQAGRFTYSPLTSQTLEELFFFQTMMNDTIILNSHTADIKVLDQKIAQLIQIYMTKIKGVEYELITLAAIIKHDYNYLEQHLPSSLSAIIQRIPNATHKTFPNGKSIQLENPIAQIIPRRIKLSLRSGKSTKIWAHASGTLKGSPNASDQGNFLLSSLALTKTKSERKKLIQSLVSLAALKPRTNYSTDFKLIEIPAGILRNTLGSEPHRWRHLRLNNIPKVGITGHFQNSPDKIASTAEFYRACSFYHWLVNKRNLSPQKWTQLINHYLTKQSENNLSHPITTPNWNALRKIALDTGKLSPAIDNLLKKINLQEKILQKKPQGILLNSPAIILPQLEGHSQLGQLAIPTHARVIDDELWIAATYHNTAELSPESSPLAHVIHVVSLIDYSIKTIKLPVNLGTFIRRQHNEGVRQFYPTKDYVYFQLSHMIAKQSPLLCIDRKTSRAMLIPLPLKFIDTIASIKRSSTLCVSVSTLRDPLELKKKNTHQVLLIKGNKIIKTLVSNQRKPPLSPLDIPDTRITKLHLVGDKIFLLSNESLSYMAPHKVKIASYGMTHEKWNLLPAKSHRSLKWNALRAERHQNITFKSISLGQKHYYFPNDLRQTSCLCLSTDKAHAIPWKPNMREGSSATSYYKLIPTSFATITNPQFNQILHTIRVINSKDDADSKTIKTRSGHYKAWRYTHNDLLKKRQYNVQVIGKWKNQYLLGLHYESNGLPAIWTIPEKTITDYLQKILAQSPSPITFNNQSIGPITELDLPLVKITAKNSNAQIWKNSGVANSQGLRINGGDRQAITLTAKGTLKNGFTSLSLHARRWRRENPFQFRISIMVDGNWSEIYNADKISLGTALYPNIKINFPQKMQKIRLELTSSPKNSVMIDNLILQ